MSDEISPAAEVPADVEPLAEELIEAETPQDEASASTEKETSDPRTHRFECRSCGYVYDPNEGVKKLGIVVGCGPNTQLRIVISQEASPLESPLRRGVSAAAPTRADHVAASVERRASSVS